MENKEINNEYRSKWRNVLCFFFPFVGFILFLVFTDKDKYFSKKCGISALIGFLTILLLSIILLVLFLIYSYIYIINHGGL